MFDRTHTTNKRSKPAFAMEARSRSGVNFSKAPDEGRARIWDMTKEGEDDDAILAAEESLHRAVISHGPGSEQTRGIATYLVLAYNHLSMKRLAENDIKVSLLWGLLERDACRSFVMSSYEDKQTRIDGHDRRAVWIVASKRSSVHSVTSFDLLYQDKWLIQ